MGKKITVAKQVDGIEMGVFEDGSTYLAESSLATWCGVHRSTVAEQAKDWEARDTKNAFVNFLLDLGYQEPTLNVPIMVNGVATLAYPEVVCMAFLEYYAFISKTRKAVAQNQFRALSRASMRIYVYQKIGYTPVSQWRQFHDRMKMNVVPKGYFSVFREMSTLVVDAIQNGLVVDDNTVPDISVGRIWSEYWKANDLETAYGARITYEHNYPHYFAQAKSNPQTPYAYPSKALGAFREWLEDVYMPTCFPTYIKRKVKDGALPPASANKILAASGAPPLAEAPVSPKKPKKPRP